MTEREVAMTRTIFENGRNTPQRKVGIGGLDVVQGTGVLRTLLGSCIGLVLQDRKNRVGGMAHIVLPLSNSSSELPGKYADTALPELIRLIAQMGGKSSNLTAKLAGGANMFVTGSTNAIGSQNILAVDRLLLEAGIPVLGRHCGGIQGRRMAFDVESGAVTVEIVGGSPAEL